MPKKFLPFLRALPSLRLPTRRYSRRLETIVPAAGKLGRIQWVLSRPLYRFRCFDLKGVPKPQRAQALQLQIRQWAPFSNSGRYLVWRGDDAMVWVWDADRLGADFQAQNLNPNRAEVLPESLLHPPLPDGLRLVACLDGSEGQLWHDGYLMHSRWWPAAPTDAEWLNFQRDAAISPELQSSVAPHLSELNWLPQPWASSVPAGREGGLTSPYETWLVSAVILVLAVMTSWYGIQLGKTRQAIELRKSELKTAEADARPILEARQRALDALARIRLLQKADLYPNPLEMMAAVAKLLPKDGAYLNEWDYRDGKLKITVISPGKLTGSALIKALLDSGWFGEVRAAPAGDPSTLTLTMEVKPWSEIREKVGDESAPKDGAKPEQAPVSAKATPQNSVRP